MERLSDADILAQSRLARANARKDTAPGIAAARYDAAQGTIVLNLDNGAVFIVPAALLEGVGAASDEDRGQMVIAPLRDGIDWPSLDVQMDLGALMTGIFGSQKWMATLGRSGGSSRSEAKARAARENGKKGGRPPRLHLG